jgi:hypothetical protein
MRRLSIFIAALLVAATVGRAQTPALDREQMLLQRIQQLEQRLAALERRLDGAVDAPHAVTAPPAPPAEVAAPIPAGTTVNVLLDGYYEYNFNHPPDRATPLRPFDSAANNFTLSQAAVVLERAPDPANGRRFGARLDLMFGSATESLSGNPANEPRTAPYRNIYQAYGTYVAPLGSGLTIDFGRFSSPLGMEATYAKDQFNYSRSLLFTALPFYHMGFRTSYKLGGSTTATWMLVNGANQMEDFNGFKSNHFMLSTGLAKNLSWTAGYYVGREGFGNGRTHIADTYLTWTATPKLTIAGEGDSIVSRRLGNSAPSRLIGGAGYAKYQVAPAFALAGRVEYVSDPGGILAAVAETLKEATLTASYQPADGFQIRWEYRHDAFARANQNTALLGLLFWFGGKQGSW